MALSLATTLGLRPASGPGQPTPNNAAAYLTFHFVFAYCVLAPRHMKQYYGLDHNVAPRQDLAQYGEAAVGAGRISRRTLQTMQRTEAAQANSIESYALFAGAVALATAAGVRGVTVNRAALVYTAARLVYGAAYILIDRHPWSLVRSAAWWVGNASCLWLLRRAGAQLKAAA